MRVLVLEAEPGAADGPVAALTAASHTVDRCRPEGSAGFPCVAIGSPGVCPLDAQPIAMALTVRTGGPGVAATEDGVACAIRANVPLVVAGETEDNPFAPWSTAVVAGTRDVDVVTACERAAAAPLPRHSGAATERLRRLLRNAGVPDAEAGRVEVTREHGRLRIRLLLPADVPSAVVRAAGTYVLAEIHAVDPTARGSDVSLGTI